ncbi:MAG: ferrous iron transport protein A [Spirochaeta sp.]|nr:ferrous iron transport protein A [Spirochaeta sp.]
MNKLLSELGPGEQGTIIALNGGRGLQARLRALGLAEGRVVRKLSALGWGGPVIVLINRAQVAIGRGMAHRIVVNSGKNESGRENSKS